MFNNCARNSVDNSATGSNITGSDVGVAPNNNDRLFHVIIILITAVLLLIIIKEEITETNIHSILNIRIPS